MITPSIIFRRLRSACQVVLKCVNWPVLLAARLGLPVSSSTVRLRNGLVLNVGNVAESWTEFSEAAILDIYGIAVLKPDLIIDVGANRGAFSCFAARLHPEAKVHAFEPQADMAECIRQNVRRNGLTTVRVHPFPVTADGRTVTFFMKTGRGSCGLFASRDVLNRLELPSVTLDTVPFRDHHSLFLMIDSEGAEGELIDWLTTHAETLPPTVSLAAEWHDCCPLSLEQACRMLANAGFRARPVWQYGDYYLYASRGPSR